jgi:hypothetical protein
VRRSGTVAPRKASSVSGLLICINNLLTLLEELVFTQGKAIKSLPRRKRQCRFYAY